MSQPPSIPDRHASKGAGLPTSIPARSSSKRKTTESLEDLRSNEKRLKTHIDAQHKKLRSVNSIESSWWDSTVSLLKEEQDLVDLQRRLFYEEYCTHGGQMSFDEWDQEDEQAKHLRRKASALNMKERAHRDQATQTKADSTIKRLQQNVFRLFTMAPAGFAISHAGMRKCSREDQARMRRDMSVAYCERLPQDTSVLWDHVLGMWNDNLLVVAAHLFPWRSRDFMDDIFGPGSIEDIFTYRNGIFVNPVIENALEGGKITIVPSVLLDVSDPSRPDMSLKDLNRERLQQWQQSERKEFKVIVLQRNDNGVKKKIWDKSQYPESRYPVESILELHNRPLVFLTDARPRTRYLWWANAHAITSATTTQIKDNKATNAALVQEVEKGVRYWGTQGSYMKGAMLESIARHVGHSLSRTPSASTASIKAGILEHSLPGTTGGPEDPTAMITMLDEVIQERVFYLDDAVEYVGDDDEE